MSTLTRRAGEWVISLHSYVILHFVQCLTVHQAHIQNISGIVLYYFGNDLPQHSSFFICFMDLGTRKCSSARLRGHTSGMHLHAEYNNQQHGKDQQFDMGGGADIRLPLGMA